MDKDTVQVPKKVTSDMYNDFIRDFSKVKVKEALFHMNTGKAIGPDGFTTLFYKKYWHIVGSEVTRVILEFFNKRRDLPNVNHTSIMMIQKTTAPKYVKDFRPINLCNNIYKIIMKTLANRLKCLCAWKK